MTNLPTTTEKNVTAVLYEVQNLLCSKKC